MDFTKDDLDGEWVSSYCPAIPVVVIPAMILRWKIA